MADERPVMLITGAGRGIGAAVARAAAAQRYHLVLNYSVGAVATEELAAAIRETGCRVVTVQADVGNEADVLRIGDLQIENRVDRISFTGDLVLTKDKAGLALAKDLQSLMERVVKALEADKQLPQIVELKASDTVKNPFS